jgi:hypothetical protein
VLQTRQRVELELEQRSLFGARARIETFEGQHDAA